MGLTPLSVATAVWVWQEVPQLTYKTETVSWTATQSP